MIIGTVSISICTSCGDGWLNRKVIFWLKLTQWTNKSCCILEITYNCGENQQEKERRGDLVVQQRGSTSKSSYWECAWRQPEPSSSPGATAIQFWEAGKCNK